MKALHAITWVILVIGGLNWGLEVFGIGIGRFIPESLAMLVYALVGISALVELFTHRSFCKHCEVKAPVSSGPMQQM